MLPPDDEQESAIYQMLDSRINRDKGLEMYCGLHDKFMDELNERYPRSSVKARF
jgi:hypothetical protein